MLGLAIAGCDEEEPRQVPADAPSVVVVMTDDQRTDELTVMPRVRRLLARRGTTFTRSFATFPLCCPSRATFLTGQYAHNHGVLDNRPEAGEGSTPWTTRRRCRCGWSGRATRRPTWAST